MSEYQYYEFLAADRPLDPDQLAIVRRLSTRAHITPTSFVNTYNFGDFKGDPNSLMEKYYDAFLYTSNWGTRRFMLRLPTNLLDVDTARRYCATQSASSNVRGDQIIIDLEYNNEDGDTWDDCDFGEGHMASIIPTREELARGDLRFLYLGWLHAVASGDIEHEQMEPPVPPGLADLSGSLNSLADFLHLDANLLDAAAGASPQITSDQPVTAELAAKITQLEEDDKDALLLRVVNGDTRVGIELFRQLNHDNVCAAEMQSRRSVASILDAAKTNRRQSKKTKSSALL